MGIKMNQQTLLNQINKLQPERGHYRIYQGFDQIGLTGQRPVEVRYGLYNLDRVIAKNSTVLDLGSNIGCMSLYVAQKVKLVHGIESFSNYVKISQIIQKYLGITNCFFHNEKILSFDFLYEFDIILSLAVHRNNMEEFKLLTKKIYKRMLTKNGYLLFESRNFKDSERFIDYLKSVGFKEEWSGDSLDPKIDFKRSFYMFKNTNIS